MMDFTSNMVVWILTIYLIPRTTFGGNVSISSDVSVTEGSNASFKCTYESSQLTENVQGAIFFLNDASVAVISFPNCTSNNIPFENIKTNCEGDRTYSITIVNISRNDHGKQIKCKISIVNVRQFSSNTLLVYVNVPVKNISISTNGKTDRIISVCQGTSLSFQCVTNAARPSPKISWIYRNEISTKETIKVGTTYPVNDTNRLIPTSSTLDVTANRTLNGWVIFCSASNIPNVLQNSSRIYLNITYAPDQSPEIRNVDITKVEETYNIIEGRHTALTCSVSISNPDATLSWIGFDYNQTISKAYNIITNKIEWVASKNDKTMYTCIAEHQCENYNKSVSLQIKVLYPPKVNAMNDIRIIEGSMLNTTCNVVLGIPKAASFTWTRQKYNVVSKSQSLMIQNISRDFTSIYICTVENTMTPTVGNNETGRSNGSVNIDVLYPPTVDQMQDKITSEGLNISFLCPFNPGNPIKTHVIWTSSDRRDQSINQTLRLENISRKDAMSYTCTVSNVMNPTNGQHMKVNNSESFNLVVEYSTTIDQFFIEGHHQDSNVTVSEHTNVTFVCIVEGNPVSTINIKHPNGTNLISAQLNNLSFSLGPIKCLDAGTYNCFGRNKHNDIHNANQSTEVLVKCSPRAHPMITVKSNITTATNVRVDMNFSALAYPLPSYFVWQKYSHNNWTNIASDEDERISVHHSGLNFSLTIYNMREENFGQYRLIISNSIGNKFIQNYTVSAEGNPDTPSNFRVITEEITSSTVTVEWSRSFDGGLPQHFVLNVSKTDVETWRSEKVPDSGETHMNFTISGLSSGASYVTILYAENIKGRSNGSEIIRFKTADHEGDKQNQNKSIVGIVIGVVFGVLGAFAAVILIVFILRKRQKESPGKSIYQNVPIIGKATKANLKPNKRISILRETNIDEEDLQEVDDVPQVQNERTEYYNSLDKIGRIDRINVSELFQYVLGKDEDEFAIEYQKIPTELQMACTFARKPENIALNRYNGIYPYDHSRVKIPSQPDFFMNACYVDGFQRSNAYIASLGPTEKTTQNYISFWQMVWHERSDVIVMLTNLREPSGMKCEQYWPDEGNMTYGEISVSCVKTEIFAEYTTRTFTLSKIREKFTVTQLHYTAWPDKTVPEDVTSLLEFRQRMIATPTTSKGPIIVHCSAGIGRTGTLIAIDRLVAEGRDKHSVNVFECVTSMREQRVKMVQTLEQYIFIYKALVSALAFDCEVIPVKDFPRYVNGSNSSKYSKQYQQLRLTVEKDKKDEREARAKNEKLANKNRIGADIPGDRFRVFLYLDIEGEANYINAVYINSLKKKDMFIMGQTPLPNTVNDFICMIYQENCICIVTMDDLIDSDKTIGKYIFENDRKHAFGNFNVTSSILETKHHYILREMKIKYEGKYDRGEKRVYHFQYKQWLEESQVPKNADDFVRFVQEIQQYAKELGDETSHILVHCMKANERSGIFCAVAIIMEMLQVHECASITNTVRRIRTRRRSAITSQEQLLFCYQAGGAFIQQLGR